MLEISTTAFGYSFPSNVVVAVVAIVDPIRKHAPEARSSNTTGR